MAVTGGKVFAILHRRQPPSRPPFKPGAGSSPFLGEGVANRTAATIESLFGRCLEESSS